MKLQIKPALKSYYLCLSPLQILKKKADYTWHLQPRSQSLQREFFKTIPLNFVVIFDGHKGKDFGIQFPTRCFKAVFSMKNPSHGCANFPKSEHFLNELSKTGRRGLYLLTKHASFFKDVICDGCRTKYLIFFFITQSEGHFSPSPHRQHINFCMVKELHAISTYKQNSNKFLKQQQFRKSTIAKNFSYLRQTISTGILYINFKCLFNSIEKS